MERRDLLLDDIKILTRALGQALADFLKLKTDKPISEAIQQTNEKLNALTNIDFPAFFELTKTEMLIELDTEMMGPEVLEELAKVCTEMALSNKQESKEIEAKKLFEKASWIYEIVETKSTTFSMDRLNRIAFVKSELNQ
jgi:GTPase